MEQAAKNAVEAVGQSVRELRIAEVVRQDVTIEDGKVSGFRIRLGVCSSTRRSSAFAWTPPEGGNAPALGRTG